MKTEVIWTTLPQGVANGKLKLSVFVSHRLYGSDGTLKSGGFEDALKWPAKDFSFKVKFSGQPGDKTVQGEADILNKLEPKLWSELMTGATPVKAYKLPTLPKAEILTLSTVHLAAMVESVYQSALELHPTEKLPAQDWTKHLTPFAPLSTGGAGAPRLMRKNLLKKTDTPPADPDAQTATLRKTYDAKIKTWRAGGKMPALDADGFKLVSYEAVRFHEPYSIHALKIVPKPDIDYHQALTSLAGYPELLRAFGFVFDLELAVPAGLAASGVVEVVATYSPKDAGTVDKAMRTAYVFNAAKGQFAAKPHADSEIVDGMLAVGREGYFVTQMDVDGAALKLVNAASAPRLMAKAGDASDRTTLPSLRSAGIGLHKNQRIDGVRAFLARSVKLHTEPDNLHLDDLIRGYRVDVWDRGEWRSLCERTGSIAVKGRSIASDWEGWISSALTSAPDDDGSGPKKLHECLWRWTGWSLAVERPGKHIDEEGNLVDEPDEMHEHFELQAKLGVPKGSLPPLRFGRKYKMRARAVDLAGNGLPRTATSSGDQESDSVVYTRFDPVLPPGMYPTSNPGYGESENHIVIRKFKSSRDPVKSTRRIVVPPEVGVSLCEQHGMFDLEDGRMDPDAYKKIIQPREKADPLQEVVKGPLQDMPYLVDPMVKGVRITYTAPEPPKQTEEAEAFGVDYPGSWPKIGSVTLTVKPVTGAAHPQPAKGDAALEIPLRPGEVVEAHISSMTTDQHLPHLGVPNWRPVLSHPILKASSNKFLALSRDTTQMARLASPTWAKPAQTPALVNLKAAISEGKVWLVTPDRDFTLVYATQIPEEPAALVPSPPSFTRKVGGTSLDYAVATRGRTTTEAPKGTTLKTHAWSTDEVEAWATWTDDLDLIEEPVRKTLKQDHKGTAFKVLIDRDEFEKPLKEKHELGDTKHHEITYTLRAHTRFRRYFDPKWDEKDFLLESEPIKFHAPSTARPTNLLLEYAIPTFGWSRPPMQGRGATRSVRSGNGLRVYLDRPWFSSGNGERLAVVLPDGPTSSDDPVSKFVTAFGADPIWAGGNVPRTATAAHFKGSVAAGPVNIPNIPGSTVTVATYPVQFDEDRQLWYADIQVDLGGTAYTPFVRLALARYQEHSLKGYELSHVTAADFMQLEPDRSATVVWGTDSKSFRVSVSGAVPSSPPQGIRQGRVVIGSVEEKAGADEDAAWRPVVVDGKELEQPIPVAARAGDGQFILPTERGAKTYRLVIREYETLPSDFREETGEVTVMTNIQGSFMGRRLVYVDVLPLS
jgi:hypothetical protein